jgi:Flp pilus assembly protein CpaB
VKRSNRLVILVGVLLAVLAFVAIVILLNNRPEGGGEAQAPTTQAVLVATEDIDIGEEVTPDKVEKRDIDPAAVQGTALGDPSAVSGQPALFAVPEGSQVSAETVGVGGARRIDISAQLNPGEKAIAFAVDRVTGLDLLIEPGDTIDLVISQTVPAVQETADSAANTDPEAQPRFEPVVGLANQLSVKAILQDKRVLYVSSTKATAPEPQDTNSDGVVDENDVQPEQVVEETVVIVFAGSEQDAEIVKFAQGPDASISAVIRHIDDDAVEQTIGITLRQLVDEFGLVIPNIIQLEVEAGE